MFHFCSAGRSRPLNFIFLPSFAFLFAPLSTLLRFLSSLRESLPRLFSNQSTGFLSIPPEFARSTATITIEHIFPNVSTTVSVFYNFCMRSLKKKKKILFSLSSLLFVFTRAVCLIILSVVSLSNRKQQWLPISKFLIRRMLRLVHRPKIVSNLKKKNLENFNSFH